MRLGVRNNGCKGAEGARCRSGSGDAGGGWCNRRSSSSSSRYNTCGAERVARLVRMGKAATLADLGTPETRSRKTNLTWGRTRGGGRGEITAASSLRRMPRSFPGLYCVYVWQHQAWKRASARVLYTRQQETNVPKMANRRQREGQPTVKQGYLNNCHAVEPLIQNVITFLLKLVVSCQRLPLQVTQRLFDNSAATILCFFI